MCVFRIQLARQPKAHSLGQWDFCSIRISMVHYHIIWGGTGWAGTIFTRSSNEPSIWTSIINNSQTLTAKIFDVLTGCRRLLFTFCLELAGEGVESDAMEALTQPSAFAVVAGTQARSR